MPGLLDRIGQTLSGVANIGGGLLGEVGRRQAGMPSLTDAQGMGLLRANAAGTGQQYLDDIRTRNELSEAANALTGLTQADQNAILSLPPAIQAQVIQNILEFRNAPTALNLPASVQEYKFRQDLPPAEQEVFDFILRAPTTYDTGATLGIRGPGGLPVGQAEIPREIAPGQTPEEQAEAATAVAQAESGLDQVLSPAQRRIDEQFAESYAAYEFGTDGGTPGRRTEERNIEIMGRVLDDLAGTLTPQQQGEVFGFDPAAQPDRVIAANDMNLTGSALGRVPVDGILGVRDVFNPQSVDVQQRIEQVVQQGLRETLGGQFAQQEGDRLIARAFNPKQEESVNIKRLIPLFELFRRAKAERDRQRAYFAENQTIAGYEPGKYGNVSISDIERVIDGEGLPGESTPSMTLESIGLTPAQIEQYNAGTIDLSILTDEQINLLEQYEAQR